MKKKMAVSIIFVIMVITVVTVTASLVDWQQFQSDEVNTGVCNDKILGRSVSWSAYTHTDPWNMAGINVVPIVANDNVYVLDALGYIWSFDAVTGTENGNKSCNSLTSTVLSDFNTSLWWWGDLLWYEHRYQKEACICGKCK